VKEQRGVKPTQSKGKRKMGTGIGAEEETVKALSPMMEVNRYQRTTARRTTGKKKENVSAQHGGNCEKFTLSSTGRRMGR